LISACGIVKNKGKFLICQRPAGVPYAGFWEFPAILLEEGQVAEDALENDFFDRIGLKIDRMEALGASDLREFDGCRMLFYSVITDKFFVSPCKLTGYADSKWVGLATMARLPMMNFCVTYVKSQKIYGKNS